MIERSTSIADVCRLPIRECDDFLRSVDDLVRDQKFARAGDRIIVVAGSSLGTPGMLNGVLIHTVGGDREEHLSKGAEAMVETEETTS